MKHLLSNQKGAFKKIKTISTVAGFDYDRYLGAWIDKDKLLMIQEKDFALVASKKKDIETGEDQK
jgi:hypothetical protein